ncbi:hypothetical protein DBT82_RS17100 [Vibrio parahaemolyticus]|uniref:hypothetical protein n=1 Tax=Vibrio parahaemolyticus TaxID=670 RepID=UPI0008139C02|nr:hypothetical protein [Vibrio parahaemolyticus]EGQ8284333.1 baseplate protein [Vibrio parahaemolyticus]EGQ8334025.1 baseplate protein [Vibrio parahaemolyticus]EGR2010509.1 baseplate protein [Vibrio parahaemolyticus]EGR2036738.1 baseplate protein [Vibrio parahaemolyticus]EGR2060557.1 baseplate protein [Vibrio parahaemolyticus]
MAGAFNAKGDMNFLKQKFTKNVQAGEKMMGTEFEMKIEEYPNISVLVRSTQFPAMGRADVEDFGQMGLGYIQNGALENKGEIAVTCVETITGTVLDMLREIVRDKKMVTVVIESTPESTKGKGAKSHRFRLEHVKARSDVIDLSTEDTAALVKPAITLQYNWVDF